MSSNDATPNRPERTPVCEQPVDVEGQYPPAAGLAELRELLNHAHRGDSGDGTGPLALLAIAEMMFHQSMEEDQRRLGQTFGRDFQRNVVPVEYVDAHVRRSGQQAMEEGRRQGRIEAHVEVGEQLTKLQLLLTQIYEVASGEDVNTDRIAQIEQLSGSARDDLAIAELARIERAAYERGLQVAGDAARGRVEELTQQLSNAVEGVRPEIDKVIDRAAEAEAKLEQIAELAATPPSGEDELAIRIRAVLEQ